MRPGYEEEYRRRHNEIWPEMVEALREAESEITQSSATDLRSSVTAGRTTSGRPRGTWRTEVNRRWSESMEPVMKLEIDPNTDFPYLLPLQWHMN